VNLAAKVEDGRQVIVPARAAAASGSGPPSGPAAGGVPGAPLNLNTATVAQLDELDGVGPATAQKIVAYRESHGGYRSVAELDQVPGIGPKRLASLKPHLTV
jgi:competence protein ComEA